MIDELKRNRLKDILLEDKEVKEILLELVDRTEELEDRVRMLEKDED